MAKAKGKKTAAKKSTPREPGGPRTIGGKVVDLTEYTKAKSASGSVSLHCGDSVAERLAGKDLEVVYAEAAKATGETVKDLKAKYGKLNVGMQRMSLGNRIRGALNKKKAS